MKYLIDIPISSIILKVHKLNRSFVFKNLGCTVTTNGGYDTEINKKILLYSRTYYYKE